MMFHDVRVIVCDLDDTLYPEREYAISGLHAAAEAANSIYRLANLDKAFVALFEAGHRGNIFQEALQSAGMPAPDPVMIGTLLEAYRTHRPLINLYDDVREVLPKLSRIARLALLTDGFLPPQRLKVEALGLTGRFDPIVFTEELGRASWKPSPAGFMLIESTCKVEPRNCVYIGDNPIKDFVAPRIRGWRTIRVRRPGTEHSTVAASADKAAEVELADFYEIARSLAA